MRRLSRVFCAALLLVPLVSCGALGGDAQPADTREGKVEQAKPKIAMVLNIDVLPLYLAIEQGWFRDEGLEITTDDLQVKDSGNGVVTMLTSGDVNIAYSSWPPFFVAQAKKVADLKLIADASAAAPLHAGIVTVKRSPVEHITDLAGKRVAVTAKNTLSHLLVLSTADASGVDPGSVEVVEVPFSAMASKLATGQIDAAYMNEPYLSLAAQDVGASLIYDVGATIGPTPHIAYTGYGARADWAADHPKTVAAFRRVLEKATNYVKVNPSAIKPLLIKYLHVNDTTAGLAWLHLPDYRTQFNVQALQDEAGLMLRFGMLKEPFTVGPMIWQPPAEGR